jgi:hypothetical protein
MPCSTSTIILISSKNLLVKKYANNMTTYCDAMPMILNMSLKIAINNLLVRIGLGARKS